MGRVATTTVVDEIRDEVAGLRREVDRLRRLVEGVPPATHARRSPEEQLASLERIRRTREEILRRRGGKLLPSSAEEIARARDERAEEILRSLER
jgi:hypothetical protein